MPTFADYRKRAFELEPSLGSVYRVASVTAQTLTVTALATGGVQSGKFLSKWLQRPQSGDALNRNPRIVTDFDSADGKFTHGGVAYTVLPPSNEFVEVHEYEPRLLDTSVARAMETCRFRDESVIPVNAAGIYWLDGLDWIVEPSDIREVRLDGFPVITNNRYMQQWNTYDDDGRLIPDFWDLTGTFGLEHGSARGLYRLLSPDSAWEVSATPGLLEVDVSSQSLRGKTVTAVLVGSTDTGSQAKVTVSDGDDSTASDFLPGTGVRTEVTAEHVISDDATTLTITAEGTNETSIEELYLCVGELNDGIRVGRTRTINRWPGWALDWQQGQPLRMDTLGGAGLGSRLVVVSQRPYTPYPSSCVIAGTADESISGAPLDLIASQAIALFFEDRANGRDATAQDASKAVQWRKKADRMRAQHLASSDSPGFTDTVLSQRGSRVGARGIR